MDMGNRIAELRSNAHMSQFQLAKVLGIGTSTLGMYETNKRKPSPKVLKRIADYFNVSTDYLLGRRNPDTETPDKPLTKNQKLVAYSIDPDISDEERRDIIEMVKIAMKNRRRV